MTKQELIKEWKAINTMALDFLAKLDSIESFGKKCENCIPRPGGVIRSTDDLNHCADCGREFIKEKNICEDCGKSKGHFPDCPIMTAKIIYLDNEDVIEIAVEALKDIASSEYPSIRQQIAKEALIKINR